MIGNRKSVGWRFLLKWIFATYLGTWASRIPSLFVLAFILSHPLLFDDPGAHMVEVSGGLIALVSAVSFGVVIGLAQWVILRRFMALRGIVWVGVTILGLLISFSIVLIPAIVGGDIKFGGVLGNIVTGGTLGVFQWLALRKRIDRAWLWIGISLLGWVIAGWIAGILAKLVAATFARILFSNTEFFETTLSTLSLWWFLNYSTSPALVEAREVSTVITYLLSPIYDFSVGRRNPPHRVSRLLRGDGHPGGESYSRAVTRS